MSTRNISWGKGARCVGLTTLPASAECLEIWEPQPPGTLRTCTGIALLLLLLLLLLLILLLPTLLLLHVSVGPNICSAQLNVKKLHYEETRLNNTEKLTMTKMNVWISPD